MLCFGLMGKKRMKGIFIVMKSTFISTKYKEQQVSYRLTGLIGIGIFWSVGGDGLLPMAVLKGHTCKGVHAH